MLWKRWPPRPPMEMSGVNSFSWAAMTFLRLTGIKAFSAEFVLNRHTLNQKVCAVWQVPVNAAAAEIALFLFTFTFNGNLVRHFKQGLLLAFKTV